jgi:hypothetical protein
MEIKIDKVLYSDIETYCKVNNIQDINGFIKKMIRKGFTMEKFGEVYDVLRNSKPEPSETIKEPSIAPSIDTIEKPEVTNEKQEIIVPIDIKKEKEVRKGVTIKKINKNESD